MVDTRRAKEFSVPGRSCLNNARGPSGRPGRDLGMDMAQRSPRRLRLGWTAATLTVAAAIAFGALALPGIAGAHAPTSASARGAKATLAVSAISALNAGNLLVADVTSPFWRTHSRHSARHTAKAHSRRPAARPRLSCRRGSTPRPTSRKARRQAAALERPPRAHHR